MSNDQQMTGRSSYDTARAREERYREGSSWKIIAALAAVIAVIGVILWFGAGTDTGQVPGQPPALAPAESSAPPGLDPTAPAPDAAAPATDPAQPAPSDTDIAPAAPVTNQ